MFTTVRPHGHVEWSSVVFEHAKQGQALAQLVLELYKHIRHTRIKRDAPCWMLIESVYYYCSCRQSVATLRDARKVIDRTEAWARTDPSHCHTQ